MKLIELAEADKISYTEFVSSQPSGNFLQSWEWGMWQESLGREVFRFKIVDDAGEWIGAVQFIKMPIAAGKFYLYAPYGPVGSSSTFQVSSFSDQLRKIFPGAVFIRVEPQEKIAGIETIGKKTINIQPGITMVVRLEKDGEQLLAAMHPKTRYNIRIAEKHGVQIQSEPMVMPVHGLYISEAIDLLVQTQVRQQYRGHSADYYKQLINFFSLKNSHSSLKVVIYKAIFEKQLLACGLMVDFGKIRMYLYGGSSDENRNVMAPYLMHWQAMQDAKNAGYTIYDLGGSEVAGGGEKGFTRFKKGFGGEVVEYAGAYDIILNKIWYTMYVIPRGINRLMKKVLK